jgi:DNA-binding MarR family transcriptional regulator
MTARDHIAVGLAKIGMVLRSHAWRQAEATGLTPTQAQLLVHLVRRGPARVSALADEIAVSQPTASDAVAALIRKGYVEKRADPDDGRAAKLHAKAAAKRVVARMEVWPDALLEAAHVLDSAEQSALLKGLTKMIRTLQVSGAVPVQRMCVTCQYFRPNQYPGAAKPHHCAFVNAAFGNADLRLDCGDHVEAAAAAQEKAWARFNQPPA